jgi:hypothetical protein
MQASRTEHPSQEKPSAAMSGWPMLYFNLAVLGGGGALITYGASQAEVPVVLIGILMLPVAIIMLTGHFALQPNEARVLILFGEYHGTVRTSGFYWASPFYARNRGGAVAQVQAAQLAAVEAAKAGTAPSYEKRVVKLDEERKAAMVGNLLVVLCGEAEVSPIVNVGTP